MVEDNEELLALMLQVLSKNYHVFTAKNGKQAKNIIMKEKLDLVVSDVMMPIMDGIELTKQLKSDKSFWQLPIILLTAKSKEEDKTEAYAAGADAYITKPFKFEELEVRINALLANRKKMIEKIQAEVALQTSTESETQTALHLSNPDQAFITRATEVVMQHLADGDYNRDSFAKDMVMSESTLYNKVKATTGQTVIAFITSIRLKEAQRIIRSNPNILISEVATQVGFNTPKYFSKCFKKEFGIFPKEYAEKLKTSISMISRGNPLFSRTFPRLINTISLSLFCAKRPFTPFAQIATLYFARNDILVSLQQNNDIIMAQEIIGREPEIKEIEALYQTNKPVLQ